jgi:hypothetical protein
MLWAIAVIQAVSFEGAAYARQASRGFSRAGVISFSQQF